MPDIDQLHGLSMEDMLARRKECEIEYYGHKVVFSYYVEKMTGSFSTDLIRLSRQGNRLGSMYKRELVRIIEMEPELDDEEKAAAQETEAEQALAKMKADDDLYKRKIAELIKPVIAEWDLTQQGKPYAITVENILSLDEDLLAAMIGKLLEGGKPMGKPSGRKSSKH